MQEAHRLGFDAALAHCLRNRLGALLADPWNLPQTGRLGRDDIERRGTEPLYESRRQGRSEPRDQTRAEVADHSFLGRGDGRGERCDAEARAVHGMLGPAAHQAYVLPGGNLAEVADGGVLHQRPGIAFQTDADHGEPPVITTKKDVFNHAFEDLLCVSGPHDCVRIYQCCVPNALLLCFSRKHPLG